MSENNAIEAIDVSYSYPDCSAAIKGISFAVKPGDAVGLVGPSGAGKTTLLRLLLGLLVPQSGELYVMGERVTPKNLKAVRQKAGLIFQNPDDQMFMPTLYDDVAFGPLNRGVEGDELDRRVRAALAERGLAGMEDKFPGHLSGGQKRLAALAGVMVMEPEALLLDEPSSNLDPASRRELIDQLAGMTNTRLVASHDLEMILDLCPRLLLLSDGKLIADGDPAQLLADENLMARHRLEAPHSLQPHRADHAHSIGKKQL